MMMNGMRLEQIKEKRLREYLFYYLEIIMVITVMLLHSGMDEVLYQKEGQSFLQEILAGNFWCVFELSRYFGQADSSGSILSCL